MRRKRTIAGALQIQPALQRKRRVVLDIGVRSEPSPWRLRGLDGDCQRFRTCMDAERQRTDLASGVAADEYEMVDRSSFETQLDRRRQRTRWLCRLVAAGAARNLRPFNADGIERHNAREEP